MIIDSSQNDHSDNDAKPIALDAIGMATIYWLEVYRLGQVTSQAAFNEIQKAVAATIKPVNGRV